MSEIEKDVGIVISRAILGETLAVFGADGNGKYGSDSSAHHYKVTGLKVGLMSAAAYGFELKCGVAVQLEGYDAGKFGHVATDKNLEISMQNLFTKEMIPRKCWTWGSLDKQGLDYFMIIVDINELNP